MHRELRDVALPHMQDVLAATGENVHLALRDDVRALYVERVHGSPRGAGGERLRGPAPPPRDRRREGAPRRGAAVRAGAVLRDLDPVTPHTVTDPGRLRQQLAEVRRRGFARTTEEMTVGTSSIAVPVRDSTGSVRAALGLVVVNNQRDLTRQLPALQVAAACIGRELSEQYT